ncbi:MULTISPECIES: aldehyde dehydrogenase family protein [unclassified Mesorhizobium]|uniref:aldehyde dehydrogenase family protein n=1 Tax=unclassified Mesorhizobium TaxID=325217 RepID=UPI002414F5BA|nr:MULTISPECIES: aldehyde dehydrogenase family protein [unclassified Mesorhizobium]MDG4889891.1 aldehyde dehydrogenase family protein [Mesorhizobium sp. WSM4887]MDG4904034.1 aldehyde dehydrogenase family protein [Mesorhizobium sp. WSM4962]MDG4909061.1 aldehyde dehydrogenase family protein [Mesorhizobium sp. WSM4898]MDG4921685.1 aldehyde dehydrogenase family protein [Mesorhizobium sp. WSM4989]
MTILEDFKADPLNEDLFARLTTEFFGSGLEIGSYVDGHIMPGKGNYIELVEPASGTAYAKYRDAGPAVAAAACEAAARAQRAWWAMTASDRGRKMHAAGRHLRTKAAAVAQFEALTSGRPLTSTVNEIEAVAQMFEYFAGWCDKLEGTVIPVPTTQLNYVIRAPYGVVVQMTPWNAPLSTGGWQIAPALASGNSVVLKPSELTPATSIILARLLEEGGLPRGLVNVLAGLGESTAAPAILDQNTRMVVFVGSTRTGSIIASLAAKRIIPCILELGGKSANIVFDDADSRIAVLGAQRAIFQNAGQACTAGSRLLVQRRVYDKIVGHLAEVTPQIPVGHPLDQRTLVGPINNKTQLNQIKRMVDEAKTAGAEVLAGGSELALVNQPGGMYYAPTLISGLNDQIEVGHEEVFGPVLGITPFEEEEEAIAIANASHYGLAGGVWTQNVGRAHRVASKIQAGTFWINGYRSISVMTPFGGFKNSGYGRSSGYEGLMQYTQTKSVWVETAETSPETGTRYPF